MMTPEQFSGILIALTGLIAAVGAVFMQLRQTHTLMNGRMTELLAATKLAGQKTGELDGRDSGLGPKGASAPEAHPIGEPRP